MTQGLVVSFKRAALALLAVGVVVVGLAGAGPAVTPAEAQEAPLPRCATYLVVGVRGSGQRRSVGEFGMGGTVDVYVREDGDQLPDNMITRYSLPYAAVPVGPLYASSVFQGRDMLVGFVRRWIDTCGVSPNIDFSRGLRIGLVGYSQGAHVIHLALEQLEDARPKIHAVLLLADPLSAGDTGYDRAVTVRGEQGTHNGGGIFNRDAVPEDIQNRTTDFCITLDPVCDSVDTSSSFAAFVAEVHTMYARCCRTFPAPATLGGEFAQRLRFS